MEDHRGATAALLEDCRRLLARLPEAPAPDAREDALSGGEALSARLPLRAGDPAERRWGPNGMGLRAGGGPLCCPELLSVLILGFSEQEVTRNSLVQEEQRL